jgi:hypothetical protein
MVWYGEVIPMPQSCLCSVRCEVCKVCKVCKVCNAYCECCRHACVMLHGKCMWMLGAFVSVY